METASNEWVKWILQAAFLIISWFIKRDLAEIKEDGKANRLMNEDTARANALTAAAAQEHKSVCQERHRLLDAGLADHFTRIDQDISHIRQRREDHP